MCEKWLHQKNFQIFGKGCQNISRLIAELSFKQNENMQTLT